HLAAIVAAATRTRRQARQIDAGAEDGRLHEDRINRHAYPFFLGRLLLIMISGRFGLVRARVRGTQGEQHSSNDTGSHGVVSHIVVSENSPGPRDVVVTQRVYSVAHVP